MGGSNRIGEDKVQCDATPAAAAGKRSRNSTQRTLARTHARPRAGIGTGTRTAPPVAAQWHDKRWVLARAGEAREA